MKKFLLAAVGSALAFIAVAPSAQAYVYDINGQVVSGYVRNAIPSAGPEQAFVVKETRAPEYVPPTFGNVEVYRMAERLRVQYKDLFLYMIKDSGIRY